MSPDDIVVPDLTVAGPTIEALKFNGHKEELSDMFAKLLATAMNSKVSEKAHPGFVQIISAMNSLDAKVLREISRKAVFPSVNLRSVHKKNLRGRDIRLHYCPQLNVLCDIPDPSGADMFHAAIDNLVRLGLIEVFYDRHLNEELYADINNEQEVLDLKKTIPEQDEAYELAIVKGFIRLSMFGHNFKVSCISD